MGKKLFRRTSAPGGPWYEYYNTVCPICGHEGMCMIHEDGNRVVCCRVPSEIGWAKNSALPGWLHFLNGKKKVRINLDDVDTSTDNKKKPDHHLNKVYSSLLDELKIKKEHVLHLIGPQRKLRPTQITVRQYRSFPQKPWEITKQVIAKMGSADHLIGVPGFHMKEGKYGKYMTLKGNMNSFLIPFRNERNQIVGLQYRVDKVFNKAITKQKDDKFSAFIKTQPNHVLVTYDGEVIFEGKLPINSNWKDFEYEGKVVGSVKIKKGNRYMWLSSAGEEGGTGAGPLPVHVAVPCSQLATWETGTILEKETVWLTEGALKADITSDCLRTIQNEKETMNYGDTVISIPGVNSWRIILPILEKMKVKRVIFAFDMDANSNPDVRRQLNECIVTLARRNYECHIAIWREKEGKGIDDILLQNIFPEIKQLNNLNS